jgi:hypothetical protein
MKPAFSFLSQFELRAIFLVSQHLVVSHCDYPTSSTGLSWEALLQIETRMH